MAIHCVYDEFSLERATISDDEFSIYSTISTYIQVMGKHYYLSVCILNFSLTYVCEISSKILDLPQIKTDIIRNKKPIENPSKFVI